MPAGSTSTSSENGAPAQELWGEVDAWIEDVLRDIGAPSGTGLLSPPPGAQRRSVLEQVLLGRLIADAIADALAPALAAALAPRVIHLLEQSQGSDETASSKTKESHGGAGSTRTGSGAKQGHGHNGGAR